MNFAQQIIGIVKSLCMHKPALFYIWWVVFIFTVTNVVTDKSPDPATPTGPNLHNLNHYTEQFQGMQNSDTGTFSDYPMFKSVSQKWLASVQTLQLNYGIAVSDVDNDGDFEMIVAGFSGENLVLTYNQASKILENLAQVGSPFEALRDEMGQAIGVCACDIDGDGREEIYFLNTNRAYAGLSSYNDKLLKWRNGKYVNLFEDNMNKNMSVMKYAGRSVACLDRFGSGKYGFAVATYSDGGTGEFALIEMDENHKENNINDGYIVLRNVAEQAGISRATGGRGIVVGPILNNNGQSDAFFDNEGNTVLGNKGENYLFKNLGNGSFADVAKECGLQDPSQHGRGVTLGDYNQDGLLDIIIGNWMGNHRLFLHKLSENGYHTFKNVATKEFEKPSLIRTVISADFDNDGHQEIFFNNIRGRTVQPNKLFRIIHQGHGLVPIIHQLNIGEALEEDGYGTGGAVTDLDGDGLLELLLSHGESKAQPLELYTVIQGEDNNWIRILPKTKHGAPARGATVKLYTKGGLELTQVIDSGSGYLCQMEPVAHFGLGKEEPWEMVVQWPDGIAIVKELYSTDVRKLHIIYHPDSES